MEIIQLTETAQAQARLLQESREDSKNCLRIAVIGGGCSGLQYKLGWDEAKESDFFHEYPNGLRVVVDDKSALFLSGSTLEYHDELNRSGFDVVNPNAASTCGCGKSFAS